MKNNFLDNRLDGTILVLLAIAITLGIYDYFKIVC